MSYEELMDRALALGRSASPFPNPRVGAVVYLNGKILGEGFHKARGMPHAEAEALEDCRRRWGEDGPRGAVVAVTLEPCCHRGGEKINPPCTEALLAAGVGTVIVGCLDPNPAVSGRGVALLRAGGIKVVTGIRNEECLRLNREYLHHRSCGRPYVHLKMAQTLDGFAARRSGGGRITGEEVQKEVHRYRAESQAVMVGAGTVRTDDPLLNVRTVPGRNPMKIVLGGAVGLLPSMRVFSPPGSALIICSRETSESQLHRWEKSGVEILQAEETSDRRISLQSMLEALGSRGIVSLFCEGGPSTAAALIRANAVDRLTLYTAPHRLGDGIKTFGDDFTFDPQKQGFCQVSSRKVGDDLAWEWEKTGEDQLCLPD